MKNYFDLTGQVAVVTGCSTGLGVQMAKALANQGAKIVAIARRKEMIEAVAKEISETYGVEAIAVQCDITDTAKVEAAVDEILAKLGRIDILINNAGTGAVAPAEDITDDQLNHEMNVDLGGTFKMARAVAKKAMLPAKYGRIINIASMYGLVGNKICGSAPYHAAKETLDFDFFQANAKTMIPAERYGNEGELDTAAIFLASKASSYVTGIMVPVDGGYTCM